jgi:hypothetical protein
MVREVFLNQSLSSGDAIDTVTGMGAFMVSVLKSHNDNLDGMIAHELVRDTITPSLPVFTPRIVEQLERVVDEELGYCEGKVVDKPIKIVQDMIAYASKSSFCSFPSLFHEVQMHSCMGRSRVLSDAVSPTSIQPAFFLLLVANIFMGPEVAKHRVVIDTFIQVPSHISASIRFTYS